jgi:hypothetical protein
LGFAGSEESGQIMVDQQSITKLDDWTIFYLNVNNEKRNVGFCRRFNGARQSFIALININDAFWFPVCKGEFSFMEQFINDKSFPKIDINELDEAKKFIDDKIARYNGLGAFV